jgi:integrase
MQIDDLMIDMLKRGLRPRTARYAYWVLKTALDRAVETGRIRQNPASRVKPPREDARETLPLTEEQVIAFFREAHKSRLYAAFVLLLFSGLRRGELLGLEWNDIDFDAMTLHVRRALVRAKGGTRYTNGKTKNAERTVPLTREVIEVLRNHKELQDKERQRAGQRWKETGLVFTTKYGNAIYPDNLNSRYLAPILKRAGLEGIHPHKFRHTFATWCVSRGIDMKKVSRWLGHASEGFTWRQYHHLLPDKTVEEDARILSDVVFTGIRDQFVTNPASSVE